jgi:hypothetical protein
VILKQKAYYASFQDGQNISGYPKWIKNLGLQYYLDWKKKE